MKNIIKNFYFIKGSDSYDGLTLIRIIIYNFVIFEIWKDTYQLDITFFNLTFGYHWK